MNNAFEIVLLTIGAVGLAMGIVALVLDRLDRRARKEHPGR